MDYAGISSGIIGEILERDNARILDMIPHEMTSLNDVINRVARVVRSAVIMEVSACDESSTHNL